MSLRALLGLASPAAATLVYVTSYAGTLTSLNLTLPDAASCKPGAAFRNGTATVEQIAVHDGCAPQASWLTLDRPNGILYCVDENYSGANGSLSSYRTSPDGVLTQLQRVTTANGPVFATLFGANQSGLALADYGAGALSSHQSDPASLAPIDYEAFVLNETGPVVDRQAASHPHQVITDPTGRFLVVPDLGADLVRVFRIDPDDVSWTASAPLRVPAGSGPRHAAFVVVGGKTFMYLVGELARTITAYSVSYATPGQLTFAEIGSAPTLGPGTTVATHASAAEVVVSPDHRFVMVSTRNDSSFHIPNFDAHNATTLVSDSISSWRIDPATGALRFVQLFPCGGETPRQFAINKAGTLLGVGAQASSRVVFIHRDVHSGRLTGFAGAIDIAGEVTSVVFDE